MKHICHVCNSKIKEFEYDKYTFVTSDCRPIKDNNLLFGQCEQCGLIQKIITSIYKENTKNIYENYDIYAQGGGAEQLVFDEDGTSKARSEQIIKYMQKHLEISRTGKLLDIGCGNGSFLSTFNKFYNQYELSGAELNEHNKQQVLSIDKVQSFYTCNIDRIEKQFDIVTLIHTLEHIENPVVFLKKIATRLNRDSFLIIQVPEINKSPFDLMIYDHLSHFTKNSLIYLLESSGYKVLKTGNPVNKEITIIAQICSNNEKTAKPLLENIFKIEIIFDYLEQTIVQSNNLKGKCAIFGSSIAATWLSSQLNEVSFFLDEDLNRIGKNLLEKPIIHPTNLPQGYQVIMPLPQASASSIAERYKNTSNEYILPPPYDN